MNSKKYDMSPMNNKSISGALTTEGGSNVPGRAGVIRGAQPGPHQANPEGASGYCWAGSGSTVTGRTPEAQEVSHFPRQAQGITLSMVPSTPTFWELTQSELRRVRMGQKNRSFSVPIAGKRGGSSTRRQVVPPI